MPNATTPPAPRRRRVLVRTAAAAGILLGAAALLAAGIAVWFYAQLRRGLPALDGEVVLPGLSAPVLVETDARGVPAIRAAGRADAARATGFLHAQNRFFQMDLLRRQAAGELAELFGPAVLAEDRRNRIHGFREVARRVVEEADPETRAVLDAYAEGVNVGLASLRAHPFEYVVLRLDPAPWRPEDSALGILAMFLVLHDEDGARESALGLIHDLLPGPLAAFLAHPGTDWDAPLEGDPLPTPPVPGPDVLDLRARAAATTSAGPTVPRSGAAGSPSSEPPSAGSNNWAVAGSLTAHGGAILANDMHLPLSVPNTWYRISIILPGGEGGGAERRITGVTLPGTPAVVAGSNGAIAWGFTNSQGDWADLVILETDPADPNAYLTPEGPRRLERRRETIQVRGRPDETLEVVSTIWGPVVDRDHRGRLRALRWTAHDPRAVDFGLLEMESARGLDAALEVAARAGIPPQNCVVADASGRIGWTIMGAIPRRAGHDGRVPVSWADGSSRWDGYLKPEEQPRIADPPSGRIWTANNRLLGGARLAAVGDGGYDLGARARQIRDDLAALDRPSEREMLAVQLDDRALFLERWRELLLAALTPDAVAADARRRELRDLVAGAWSGRASVESAAYRMVRAFRQTLAEQVLGALTAGLKAADDRFAYWRAPQWEGPLWRLATERPAHLLDPVHAGWDAQILAAADAVVDLFLKEGGPLARHTWGRRNTARIRHPMSLALPAAGAFLDMEPVELPGDAHMPRVQSPDFGASERLAVSPGREERGFFHMPAGQSGHPLSPHYRDGHAGWAAGEPAPFLPGPPAHTLTLRPDGR
jgi:penicillin amidase